MTVFADKLAEVQTEFNRVAAENLQLRETLVTIKVNAMRRGSDPDTNAWMIDAFEVIASAGLRGEHFGPAFSEWEKTQPYPHVVGGVVALGTNAPVTD